MNLKTNYIFWNKKMEILNKKEKGPASFYGTSLDLNYTKFNFKNLIKSF